MEKKNIQIIVIILVTFVTISFIIDLNRRASYNEGYLEGQKEVEAKYQEKIAEIFPSMPEREEIFSVFGTINEIKGETIVLKAESAVANPFEESKIETKHIQIDDKTEFVKQVERTSKELRREEEQFSKTLKENPEDDIMPPLPFKEVPISFSELKKGDKIRVESEENIKNKVEFLAKKVTLAFN